jgi:environmental stress-induced protein Ves
VKLEVRELPWSGTRPVPWKNGGGTTRELALWPESARFERGDYDWRLSTARVEEAGPFSAFAGFERILTVTEGAGLVVLHEDAAPRARVRRLEPYRFSGDWPTRAELPDGAVSDFNVILRRGRARADVQALALGRRRWRDALGLGHAFLHAVGGRLQARVTGEEEPFALGPGDSLWLRGLSGREELELTGATDGGAALLVALHPD